jgi:hypothetical protein
MRSLLLYCTASLAAIIGCRTTVQQPDANIPAAHPTSVWSVDLVRTMPGAQADYLRSIETNWTNGRRVARTRGAVRSYRALVAAPDSARGWDVILMTEYADSAAFLRREAIFEEIFASPQYVRVEPARPSAQMRAFATTNVAMRMFVSEPR